MLWYPARGSLNPLFMRDHGATVRGVLQAFSSCARISIPVKF